MKIKGFTIIELIVVIAIIAILASVVMVNVTQYINKSKDASIKANMDSIKKMLKYFLQMITEAMVHMRVSNQR